MRNALDTLGARVLTTVELTASRFWRITQAGVTSESPGGGASFEIASGPDTNLWLTEPDVSRIGRITPAGVVTEFLVAARQNPG